MEEIRVEDPIGLTVPIKELQPFYPGAIRWRKSALLREGAKLVGEAVRLLPPAPIAGEGASLSRAQCGAGVWEGLGNSCENLPRVLPVASREVPHNVVPEIHEGEANGRGLEDVARAREE